MDVEHIFIKGEFAGSQIGDRDQIARLYDKLFICYQISAVEMEHLDRQAKEGIQKQFADMVFKYHDRVADKGVGNRTIADIYFLNNPEALFENNELDSELFVYLLEPFLIAVHYFILSILIIQEHRSLDADLFDEAHRVGVLSNCEYFSGLCLGTAMGYDYGQETKLVSHAKKASDARHDFNRKRTEKLISYFQDNRDVFKSKNEAAEIMANIFNLAPKTVREKLNKL